MHELVGPVGKDYQCNNARIYYEVELTPFGSNKLRICAEEIIFLNNLTSESYDGMV